MECSLDARVRIVLEKLMAFIVPEGMSVKDRNDLAQRAGISPETLRKNLQRNSLNADTLIRLLLARGVTTETLTTLPQLNLETISKGEQAWLQFGLEITDRERLEFLELLRYIMLRWELDASKFIE